MSVCPFISISLPLPLFLPNDQPHKKIKDVPVGEINMGKLLTLLCVWLRVQDNLFFYYFLCKEGTGKDEIAK
jgi:hypothetical protein